MGWISDLINLLRNERSMMLTTGSEQRGAYLNYDVVCTSEYEAYEEGEEGVNG